MLRGLLKTGCAAGAIREVKELAMQEIDAIAAAEKQARAICEQAKVQAAELSARADCGHITWAALCSTAER